MNNSGKKYKNIIFDVGEVLLSYRWKDAMVDAGISREAAEEIGSVIFSSPLWKELDLGIRPYWDVVEDIATKYGKWHDEMTCYLTKVERMTIDRPKVWEKMALLKEAGYKCYILSNYPGYIFERHMKDKPFLQYLDGMMVSYSVNFCKPDRRIYEALLQKYNLNPKDCIFFDDRKENTDGAIACGIDAVTVESEDILLEQIDKLLEDI